jgi:hypothetical protein
MLHSQGHVMTHQIVHMYGHLVCGAGGGQLQLHRLGPGPSPPGPRPLFYIDLTRWWYQLMIQCCSHSICQQCMATWYAGCDVTAHEG